MSEYTSFMKQHKSWSFFYSLFIHAVILSIIFLVIVPKEEKVIKVQEKYHPIHLQQVHEHQLQKSEVLKPVVKVVPKVTKKVKPTPKKRKKPPKVKKPPKKRKIPLKKKKPVPPKPKPKIVEKPKPQVVEEKTVGVQEKAEEVIITPTQKPVLSSAAVKEIAKPVTPKTTPKEQYIKSNISEIMGLLRKHLYYPRMARKRHIEGKVVVEFELLIDGSIQNIKIIEAHREILGRAAVTTIERLEGKLPKPSEKLLLKVPIMYKLK